MLYTKPDNITYVDMCIQFDKEFNTKNRDDTKLFKYMYLIYYMLACKSNYFKKYDDYDEFAKYAATTIYMRFLKKEAEGVRIKSILNYAKSTVYPLKVSYQNENFLRVENPDLYNKSKKADSNLMSETIRSYIKADYNEGKEDDMIEIISSIPKIITKVVKSTPYKKDKLMCKRLYMSCLLTLLNSITLTNANRKRLNKKIIDNTLTDDYVYKMLDKERYDEPILWNLDSNLKDYIRVLTNRIRMELNNILIDSINYFNLSEDVIDSILLNATAETHGIREVINDEK